MRKNHPAFTLWYLPADLKTCCLLCNTDSDAVHLLGGIGWDGRLWGCGPRGGATNKPEKHWNFRFSTQTHERKRGTHPQGSLPFIIGLPVGMTLKRDAASTPWMPSCHPQSGWGHAARTRVFVSLGWCNHCSWLGNLVPFSAISENFVSTWNVKIKNTNFT